MNVRKKSLLFSVIFGFIICFGLITCHDVSAIENYTLTLTNQSSIPQNIDDISGYNYIYISATGDYGYTDSSQPQRPRIFQFTNGCYSMDYVFPATVQQKIYHSSICPGYLYKDTMRFSNNNLNYIPDGASVTIVLSENSVIGGAPPSGSLTISANGTFNVSNYASVDVNVPTGEDSRFMGVVIDSFWQYHVAFASACVGIIVIFLVYRLIKGRLR